MSETLSSGNIDPQLLLESGPMMIRDFNPKGVLYWTGRKCLTCGNEILDHWLLNNGLSDYYCDKLGQHVSEGIADTRWDVPEGFGK